MEKREEYVQKLKGQLDIWNAEVAKWELKSKEAQASARAEYDRQLTEFRRHRDHAVEQLQQVQTATGNAWLELTRGADEAWARMRESFEKASSQFRK